MQITSERIQTDPDLKAALDMAHSKTRLPGSCTACLAHIDGETGKLSALNLGDSGFLVLRNDRIIARSSPQQHFFDCPVQLAAFPEHCDQTDYPKDGQTVSLSLQQGDLIIMGTPYAYYGARSLSLLFGDQGRTVCGTMYLRILF